MPFYTEWVCPEVFMTYNGITVYYTYMDDDISQGTSRYQYTTCSYNDFEKFDVRYLKVPSNECLGVYPPFDDCSNSEYSSATEEQKTTWTQQWREWQAPGGGLEKATVAIIKEAIDLGLIIAAEDDYPEDE